jgi:hypothetical protein
MAVKRRGIMSGEQIDNLCRDWLRGNYGEAIASEYTAYSLVVPLWNSPDANDALECLKLELCLAFGSEKSFGTTDYYQAREKLGLADNRASVPDVFTKTVAKR